MQELLHKRLIFTFFIVCSVGLLLGCSGNTEPAKKPQNSPSSIEESQQKATSLEIEEKNTLVVTPQEMLEKELLDMLLTTSVGDELIDRFSYTYGYMLMDSAMREIPSLQIENFLKGALDAGYLEEELLTSEERNTSLFEFQDSFGRSGRRCFCFRIISWTNHGI